MTQTIDTDRGEVRGDIDATPPQRTHTATALLDHRSRGDYDLVAAGTHGQTELERHLTGSVSTALVRGVSCTVLIAPPLAPAS